MDHYIFAVIIWIASVMFAVLISFAIRSISSWASFDIVAAL
jgi:hypothetical protein